MKRLFHCFFFTLIAIGLACPAYADSVLVGHPLTVGLAERLFENTPIEIMAAAPKNLPAGRQLNYYENRGKDELANLSRKADIVLTVRSIYAQDYLYPHARRHNIRLIPIDIATPIDGSQSGVALIDLPIVQHQVWLNPDSLGAMINLLAREMSAYSPELKAQISDNAAREQKRLLALSDNMEHFLSEQNNEPVFLIFNPELSYLAQGLQAFSILAELPTPDNYEELATLIRKNEVNLALYHSKLDAEQTAFLKEHGVKLIVVSRLKSDDPISQLEALYQEIQAALSEP